MATADKQETQTEAKHDPHAALHFFEYLRRYTPERGEPRRDMLGDRFQIDLSAPLPELDQSTAKAFVATDTLDSDKRLCALVCNSATIQRMRTIQLMRPLNHANSVQLMGYGVVHLSQPAEERYVLVYERPPGRKLSEMLTANPSIRNEQFIIERIIAPLAAAITYYTDNDVVHGCINHDTVFVSDYASLGPSLAEPCGMGQHYYYETVERMQALPAGKGEGNAGVDFYALGVLVLYIVRGPNYFARFNEQGLIQSILKDGVFQALTKEQPLPDSLNDFFLGVFSQNPADRWQGRHIKAWIEGKRFNVLTPPSPSEGQKPFEYAGVQAHNRRELAHVLATHWELAGELLSNGQMAHWASVSLRNKPLSDVLARIGRIAGELSGKNEVQHAEQLMRAVLVLDPTGPIRFKQLAFNIDGLDTLCATLFFGGRNQELQYIAKFIEYDMATYWLELQRQARDFSITNAVNSIIMRLDRLRPMIRQPGLGFGLERMLYELNPDMPCISPLCAGVHVTTLVALLRHLDKIAATHAKDEDPIDRHIAGFVAAKLGLQHEIRLNELSALPHLAQNRSIIALQLLAQAQQRASATSLPGLAHWLAIRVLPSLDSIHSASMRSRIRATLHHQAQEGLTPAMAELIVRSNFAVTDQTRFQQAQNRYLYNAHEIQLEKSGIRIEQRSGLLGLKIARMIALGGFVISLLSSWGGLW